MSQIRKKNLRKEHYIIFMIYESVGGPQLNYYELSLSSL
jgi:hypothetical protein